MVKRRQFTNGRIYYGVHFELEDRNVRQPVVVSFRYAGKVDAEGRHVFQFLGRRRTRR